MLNIDNPINPKLVKELNSKASAVGLNSAFKWLLGTLNVKIKVSALEGERFSSGPKLIISNHHGSIDAVSLLSVIPETGLH